MLLFKRDKNPNFSLIQNDADQKSITDIFQQMEEFLWEFETVRIDKLVRRSKNYIEEVFVVVL